MAKDLTDLDIRKAKTPAPGERLELKDAALPGLILRVTPQGQKHFYVRCSLYGRYLKLKLGAYPKELTLAQARAKAGLAKALAKEGTDPRSEPSFRTTTPGNAFLAGKVHSHPGAGLAATLITPDTLETYSEAVEKFLLEHCARKNKPSTAAETGRLLKTYFKGWNKRPLATITKKEIIERINEIIRGGAPSSARHADTALRTFFTWCTANDIITANPTTGTSKPARDKDRDRVLNTAELRALCKTARDLRYPYGTYLELLLLTGQRRGEVAGMRHSEIDYTENLWKIPKERTKNKTANYIPLTPRLRAILKSLPDTGSDHLFPPNPFTERPFTTFSHIKKVIDRHSGITGWRIHDIRRTVSTNLGFLGIQQKIINKLLNHHALTGAPKVYQLYEYLNEKDDALRMWHAHLKKLTKNSTDITITRRRRQYPTVAAD